MELLKNAKNPEFWNEFRKKEYNQPLIQILKDEYEKTSKEEIETTKFSKFRLYKDIGDRMQYQETFFKRERRLYLCSLLTMIYPENEEYLKLLQDTIWNVCDEYVWALPAHIKNSCDENKANSAILDLDATSISAMLAITKSVLENRLHPLIKSRIDFELDKRLIQPFLAGEWYWENLYNNWTAVCSGNTGIAFMLNRPDLFDKVKDRINNDMEKYLSSYKDDGACTEGIGYWGYGFSSFTEYATMLKDFTDGKENFFAREKVKNISMFLQKMYIDKDVIMNYGDSALDIMASRGLIYRLKENYGEDIELPPQSRLEFNVGHYTTALSAVLLNCREYMAEEKGKDKECYMGNVGLYIKKTEKYGIGAKGGSNGESHNHNDVGSFIFAKNNEQVLVDMGLRPYTKQYFESATRYTYLETSSKGHNVPIINGCYQVNSGDTTSQTSFENGVFSVRYEKAYQTDGLTKLQRDFKACENYVEITNSFESDKKISYVERLVSFKEPKISENKISLGDVSIIFDNSILKASVSTDEHTLTLNTDGSAKTSKTVYLIDMELIANTNKFSYKIEA